MAERITRPTVRLAGGLPDGNLSNLETLGGRLLSQAPPDVYAIVLLSRAKLIEDDDQDGAETAVMKVRALEALPLAFTLGQAATFPFDVHAGDTVADVLQRLRTDRTGEQTLPVATTAEAQADDQAREAIRAWADANLDQQRDGLAAEWTAYFADRSPAGTVTSWRDAPRQMIAEFLAYKGEPDPALTLPGDDTEDHAPGPVTAEAEAEIAADADAEPDDDGATRDAGPVDTDDPGPGAVPAATFAEPTPDKPKRTRGGLAAVQP